MKHLPFLRIFCLFIIVFLVLGSASLAANTGLAQRQFDLPLTQVAEMDRLDESPQVLDQEIILSAAGYEGGGGSSYYSITAVVFQKFLPFISENNRNTSLYIQNLAGSAIEFAITFIDKDGNYFSPALPSSTIPAGGMKVVDLNSLGLPAGFEGSSIISATGPFGVVANIYDPLTHQLLAYNGIAIGSTTLVLPQIMRNADGLNSSIWVQNIGSSTTDISIEFLSDSGDSLHTVNDTIPTSASHTYHQADMSQLGDGFSGWALVTSAGGDIAAVVELQAASSGDSDDAAAYEGIPSPFSLSHISQSVSLYQQFLPRQQKNVDGWSSSIKLLNPGSNTAQVVVTLIDKAGTTINLTPIDLLSGRSTTINLQAVAEIPTGFDGSAVISSDQSITVLGQQKNVDSMAAGRDVFAVTQGHTSGSANIWLPQVSYDEAEGIATEISVQNVGGDVTSVTLSYYDQSGVLTAVVTDQILPYSVERFSTADVAALGESWEGSVAIESNLQPVASDAIIIRYLGSIDLQRPVILLPGLTGSRLDNNPCVGDDYEVWPDPLTLFRLEYDEHLRHLGLAENGTDPFNKCDDIYVNRSTGIKNIENGVIRNMGLFPFYGSLIDHLESQGFSVYPYGYDWRLDLKDIANNLDTYIDQVLADTGADKVDIVDHSLGGLLARYYVTSINANKIGQVISLGTPFLGAPKSLLALRWGSSGFWDSDLIGIGPIYPPRVQEISQNAPAFYQILPTARYFDVNGGGYFRVDGQLKDLSQTRFSIMSDHNANLALDAEIFHSNAMDDWGSYPLDVNFTLILGSGKVNTPGELHERTIIDWLGYVFVIRDIIYTDGDGTVPIISASLQGNGEDYSGNAAIILYKDISHLKLITDETILALITDLLSFPQNSGVSGMTIPLSDLMNSYSMSDEPLGINGAQIAVWGDVNVHVYDDQGNHTGPMGNGGVELSVPESSYEDIGDAVFVTIGGVENYIIQVELVSGDYFDMKIRDIQSSVIQRTISYSNVPANEGGNGSYSYSPGSVEPAPILELDTNNDGVIDILVPPTGDVGLDGNDDFTGPTINVELDGQIGPYGWYVGDVAVTITASDDETGVSKIEYSTDRGLSVIEYSNDFIVSAEQVSLLIIQATDNAGNKTGISTNIGSQKVYVPIITRND